MPTIRLFEHPVFKYGLVSVLLVLAVLAGTWSFQINVHSFSWLVGIYLTSILLILANRQQQNTKLRRSFFLYLSMLLIYLTSVWLLHVTLPGNSPEAAKEAARFWLRILGFGGVYLSVSLFRFTIQLSGVRHGFWTVVEAIGWILGVGFHLAQLTNVFFGDFIWFGHTWVATMTAFYPFFFGFTALYVTLALAVPMAQIFRTTNHHHKLQLIYFLIGAIPLWLSCLSHFLLSLGVPIYPAGGVFYIVHTLILGYATLRHRVFDVSVVIRRGLPYAIVSVVIGSVFGGLIYWVSRTFDEFSAAGSMISCAIVVAVAALLYVPITQFLQAFMDRKFFKTKHDRETLLVEFSREVTKSLELERVLTLLGQVLYKGLNPSRVRLFVCSEDQLEISYFGSYEEGVKAGDKFQDQNASQEWIGWLRTNHPISAQKIEWAHDVAGRRGDMIVFEEGPQRLIVPIRFQETTLGFAVLGAKRTDESYKDDEMQFAETVAAHTSTALQNARSHHRVLRLQTLMRESIQAMPAAIVLLRESGEIELHNKAFETLVKFQGGRLENSMLSLKALKGGDEMLVETLDSALTDRTEFENRAYQEVRPRQRFLMLSCRKVGAEASKTLFLFVIHDLTEFRRMEETLKLKEGLSKVGEFVSAINHEIRNVVSPFRGIMSRLEKLDIQEQSFREIVSRIPERIGALDGLIEGLRNYSRPIELRRRNVDLPNIVSSARVSLERRFEQGGVQLVEEYECSICFADGDWLKLVLVNLMKNALEATAGRLGASVSVKSKEVAGFVLIEVEDNGPGIESQALERLFQPFFTTKGERGTGLGLSICRKVVDLHGGRIECQSKEGEGCCFRIFLPTDQEIAPAGSKSKQIGSLEG